MHRMIFSDSGGPHEIYYNIDELMSSRIGYSQEKYCCSGLPSPIRDSLNLHRVQINSKLVQLINAMELFGRMPQCWSVVALLGCVIVIRIDSREARLRQCLLKYRNKASRFSKVRYSSINYQGGSLISRSHFRSELCLWGELLPTGTTVRCGIDAFPTQ